ncbi:MAG: ABC transporter permease [Dactylosporangium sp.]|nr:permease-like cell division protein FtsX [Dactylosporangium sp.]NNJ60632.1 ABC transporter permease [Dactylosporangium sp.]
MRLNYILTEVLTGLWRNVTMTIAMIITMAVSLTMLGASLLLYQEVNDMEELYYGKVEVSIYLLPEVTDEEREALDSALKADPLIRQYSHKTKEEAYAHFRQIFRGAPDLVDATKPESLPESFQVKLKDPTKFKAISEKYNGQPGIDDIVDQQKTLEKLFNILGSMQNLALIVAIVQGIAALLLVANTIQVAAYSKRREVAVMKLVGASNWFIQMPFVLEAIFAGVIGSVLAFGILMIAKTFLLDGTFESLTTVFPPILWTDVVLLLPLLAGVAAGVSAVTGWITLRFYVRV